jgi:hypothetical protein
VPDPLDVFGVSSVARASRLQRTYRRRAAASQSDAAPARPARPIMPSGNARPTGDVAVDFVAMTEIVPRMRAAFFAFRQGC